jgi:hypothetical protein
MSSVVKWQDFFTERGTKEKKGKGKKKKWENNVRSVLINVSTEEMISYNLHMVSWNLGSCG